VCAKEEFDPTPYSKAIAQFFLRNPVCQNLPRKFKINFSCCADHGLVRIADIGLVPMINDDGVKGFRVYLGGGLGAASFLGHLLEDFTSEDRLLATCLATIRLFDRYGNRENMARNRMRYLVNETGWDTFQRMVIKERSIVEMTVANSTLELFRFHIENEQKEMSKAQRYLKLPVLDIQNTLRGDPYERWMHTNVVSQKQQGYFTAFVTLGAGDITANQLRVLSGAIRDFSVEGTARNTPQQNFAIRYINEKDLYSFYARIATAGLINPGALTIASAVGCTGTTSCNLAITNSHRLAKEIEYKFLESQHDIDDDLRDSTIKISGCPNSCGQHEVATIGFFGGASRINNSMAPTYTMLFSGNTGERGELGKTIMRVPAKRVINILGKIIEIYKHEKSGTETLKQWISKIVNGIGTGSVKGVDDIKVLLSPVAQLDPVEQDPESYKDYGSDIRFSAKTARGECAA